MNYETNFCGFKLENPFCLASSPVAMNYDMCKRALDKGWAGIFYKTITLFENHEVSPRFDAAGNGSWYCFRNLEQLSEKSASENFEILKKLKSEFPTKFICASIMGSTVEEWTKLATMAEQAGVDAVECNFSCPQTTLPETGNKVGIDYELVKKFVAATRKGTKLPIVAKMTPNITSLNEISKVCLENGATAISLINTVKSIISIDLETYVPAPNVNGFSCVSGMSGKSVKPIGLRFMSELNLDSELKKFSPEYSGIGGVYSWSDCLEYVLLGAKCVQVCTAVMEFGYDIIESNLKQLDKYLQEHNTSIDKLVGKSLEYVKLPEELDRSTKCVYEIDSKECLKCGRCFKSCSDGGHCAIENVAGQYQINKSLCKGCGLCKLVCPKKCIKFISRIAK